MRLLFIKCRCGHQAIVPWGSDKPTLKTKIQPRMKCSQCRQKGIQEVQITWTHKLDLSLPTWNRPGKAEGVA